MAYCFLHPNRHIESHFAVREVDHNPKRLNRQSHLFYFKFIYYAVHLLAILELSFINELRVCAIILAGSSYRCTRGREANTLRFP